MGILDHLKMGIQHAQELGHHEVTTDLIRSLRPEKQTSIISALEASGFSVHYRGPMTFNFPHHLIKLKKPK